MLRMQNPALIDYLQLMRAPAVFTAFSNILAAHLIATQGSIVWSSLLFLLGATAGLYLGGMVLNDWFDYRHDLASRPNRPLPAGRIPCRNAMILGIGLLLTGLGLATLVGFQSMLVAMLIVLLVLIYDGWSKDSLLGSLNMAACRYFNWLLGFSILPITGEHLIIASPVFIYVTALTLLSREEEAAQHRWILMLAASGIGAAILCVPILTPKAILQNPWPAILASGLFITLIRQFYVSYREFTPQQIQATLKLLIFGIIPLDALLVLGFGPWWGALAVLSLLPPGRLLARFMYVT